MTVPHHDKKKVATIVAYSVVLLAMVGIVAVGFSSDDSHGPEQNPLPKDHQKATAGESNDHEQKASPGGSHDPEQNAHPAPHSEISTSSKAVKSICEPTDYKETCEESLSKAAGNTSDPKDLVKAGFQVTIEALKEAINKSDTLKEVAKDRMASQALDVCKNLMDDCIADVQNSLDHLVSPELSNMDEVLDNLKVWLSAAISYQESCIDAFKNTRGDAGEKMKEILRTSTMLTSNGLAMVNSISEIIKDLNVTAMIGHRRLLEEHEFPSWVDEEKRRLLAAAPPTIKKDMTVAKDGSGNFRSITEAIKSIPKNSKKTFVLYVKAGDYMEQITFPRELSHVLLLGDGPTKTKISGKLNFAAGVQALNTATVTTVGAYFMAKDIGFENMAGPTGHEALALRVQSDFSVFYNCHMNGYQETLYAHANRQFYRGCTITGTVDIIKGDARAVFQKCTIIVRKPLLEQNQKCYVTSQGRNNTREPTGFVLQDCRIMADKGYYPVRLENKAYLGRPWKEYARTIIMQSTIDDLIDPKGWGTFFGSYGTSTCYFAEYGNKGAGADTKMRVAWKGYKKITPQEAQGFTAAKFLGGDSWIVASGVPYTAGLIKV